VTRMPKQGIHAPRSQDRSPPDVLLCRCDRVHGYSVAVDRTLDGGLLTGELVVKTRSKVPMNTRKRFRAHQSIYRKCTCIRQDVARTSVTVMLERSASQFVIKSAAGFPHPYAAASGSVCRAN
jgi:hypothetical protein